MNAAIRSWILACACAAIWQHTIRSVQILPNLFVLLVVGEWSAERSVFVGHQRSEVRCRQHINNSPTLSEFFQLVDFSCIPICQRQVCMCYVNAYLSFDLICVCACWCVLMSVINTFPSVALLLLVSEMIYNVSSGTLNTTIPYHTLLLQSAELIVYRWLMSVSWTPSNFFFKSLLLLQFLSDSCKTWFTWSMCQYAKKYGTDFRNLILTFLANFWNLDDLVSRTSAA